MSTTVTDNPARQRYEIHADGVLAGFVEYRPHGSVVDFVHTEMLPGFEGRGLAASVVAQALDEVRRRGWHVQPECPYVRRFIVRHPAYHDLVVAGARDELFADEPA